MLRSRRKLIGRCAKINAFVRLEATTSHPRRLGSPLLPSNRRSGLWDTSRLVNTWSNAFAHCLQRRTCVSLCRLKSSSVVMHQRRGKLAKFDLREYARDGARARAEELKAELAKIYRLFPDLRGRTGAGRRATGPARRARRRKGMTAAQKKAVSLRMKKYWASRRKATA